EVGHRSIGSSGHPRQCVSGRDGVRYAGRIAIRLHARFPGHDARPVKHASVSARPIIWHSPVKWFAGALVLLLISLVFDLGLLAYAMYVLLGVMLISRWISRAWCDSLAAQRECNTLTAEVGQTVAVVVKVRNTGRLPIAWVLMEDLLPRSALAFNPPSLGVKGSRLQVASLRRGARHSMLYQLQCNRRGY